MPTVINVASAADLRAAIATVDNAAIGAGEYDITFTSDITLSAATELYAFNLKSGVTAVVNGAGHTLDGGGVTRGLFIFSGAVEIDRLTIANAVATGGRGADGLTTPGGGGAGLGGGLFIANRGVVTLNGVTFTVDQAVGGAGGVTNSAIAYVGGAAGGGGGLGGSSVADGGYSSGGGGVGLAAIGHGDGATAGGAGILLNRLGGGRGYISRGGDAGGGGGSADHEAIYGAAGGGDAGGNSRGVDGGPGAFGGGGGGGNNGGAGGFGGGGGGGFGPYPNSQQGGGVGGAGGYGGGGGAGNITGGAAGFGAGHGGAGSQSGGGGGLGAGGAVFVQAGGSLTWAGAGAEGTGGVTGGAGGAGGATPATGGLAFGAGIYIQGNQTLTFAPTSGQTITVGDTIADQTGSGGTGGNAGAGALLVNGAGTLSLGAANTFTGGVTVTGGGTLVAGHRYAVVDALGSGAIKLNGGTLQVALPGGPIILNNIVVQAGGGTLDGGLTGAALGGAITGSGALTIVTGTAGQFALLADESAFTGSLTLAQGGTIRTAAANALPANAALTINSGATLDLSESSQTAGSLSGGGTVTESGISAALTTGGSGVSTTFSGVLQSGYGVLAFTKVGAGVLTLTGANSYTGGTTVSGGTLQIGAGGAAGAVAGNIADNATLQFSRSDATTFGGAISGTGAVVVDSGGTLTLSNTNTYQGGTTVTGGATLVLGHGDNVAVVDSVGSGGITLSGGKLQFQAAVTGAADLNNSIDVEGSGNVIVTDVGGAAIYGALTGSGALSTASGAGYIELIGDNSAFTGSFTVASGYVTVTTSSALPHGAVSVNANATLQLLNNAYSVDTLSGAGTVSAHFTSTAVPFTVGGAGSSSQFDGVLTATSAASRALFSLIKAGAGVFTLTGADAYTGATTVSGGVLAVDGSLTSTVTVASGATLRGTGTDSAGLTVQAGATFAPGEGTGTFTAASLSHSGVFSESITATNAFGQAHVTSSAAGAVTLAGTLSLAYTGGAEAYGTVYRIVDNTGSSAVSGTFSGLAEGATLTSGGRTFQISYVGGTGNDVTLTDVAPPPPPSPPAPSSPAPTPSTLPTAGNDLLTANAGGDTVLAGGGDDTINGGSGHDQLYGNTGNDVVTLSSSTLESTVYGGMGDDTIDASASSHANLLSGDLGNDLIRAGSGADTVFGGDGADTLISGSGHDQLYGNAGNDVIVLSGVTLESTVYGGMGNDVIDACASTHANFLSGDLGDDSIRAGSGADTVYGGGGADTVIGGAGADALYGNAGNDLIRLQAAGTVFGGQGDDSVTATDAGAHYISGDLGADTITSAGTAGDSLYGGQGNDVITAADNATVYGGQGDDIITVSGGAGSHHLVSGDLGNDRIVDTSPGGDTLAGGAGTDTITVNLGRGASDLFLVHSGDSTAQAPASAGGGEANLDHLSGFISGLDRLGVAGHTGLVASGPGQNASYFDDAAAHTGAGALTTEAQAYQAAYAYAFVTAAAANFASSSEYLEVHETYAGAHVTYVFGHDGFAVALLGQTGPLGSGDIVTGS